MLSWFDSEVIPSAWFDPESQLNGGFFDEELIYITVTTIPAICLNPDGSLTYRLTAGSSDVKLYLNNGNLFARLSPTGGDKILTLSAGQVIAT